MCISIKPSIDASLFVEFFKRMGMESIRDGGGRMSHFLFITTQIETLTCKLCC